MASIEITPKITRTDWTGSNAAEIFSVLNAFMEQSSFPERLAWAEGVTSNLPFGVLFCRQGGASEDGGDTLFLNPGDALIVFPPIGPQVMSAARADHWFNTVTP